MKLFEYILREADKSRFLKPLWDQFSDQLEDNNITYEELLSFVNKDDPLLKQQFEMRGINWQKKGSDAMLWVAIISAFNARKETNKQKEIEKAAYKAGDVISMIKSEKMLYLAGETEEATDCDFVHLPTLDNDKFTFVVPMTWDACRFCDSAKMGGEGAKWCIGYEQSDSYWKEYTGNGDLFILAFNNEAFKKGKNREEDTLKYMIQLSDDYRNTVAWKQSDNPDEVIPINKLKKVFGHDPIEMVTAFANRIMCDDNVYTDNSNGSFYDYENEEATYPWDENRLVDNEFYIKEFYNGEYDITSKFKLEDGQIEGSVNKQKVYDKGYSHFKLNCNCGRLSPGEMFIGGNFDKGIFDIPTLCDWLKQCGCKNITDITIIDADYIGKVMWEPDATDNKVDVYFENCYIQDLVFADYSDGETTINFDENCVVKNLIYSGDVDSMNTDSIKLESQGIIQHEVYEDEED